MSLTARISPIETGPSDPEDLFGSALAVIFPDDVMVHHGDATTALLYTSPHLPSPLRIKLADPLDDGERRLFGHYLWNASLLLAEFIEAGTLGLPDDGGLQTRVGLPMTAFDVKGKKTIELGAGTALPSIMAALLGAQEVLVTDYPSDLLLATLRRNVTANTCAAAGSALPSPAPSCVTTPPRAISVHGHEWGRLDAPPATTHAHAFDVVFAADCLWMPWQHDNLRRSIAHFLRQDDDARAWVVAGFHTGRERMAAFFDEQALGAVGLSVERLWERDCDGVEMPWGEGAAGSEVSGRKRWLVVGVLKRLG